jgi:RNA polymerase sigma-70 factor (ECF subfamily)
MSVCHPAVSEAWTSSPPRPKPVPPALEPPSLEAWVTDLVATQGSAIRRVLRLQGVQAADLDDVCQEVFLAAWRGLPAFRGESSPRTWLIGIARRIAWSHLRRARHRRTQAWGRHEPGVPAPQIAHIQRQEALRRLERRLEGLDEARRAAFVLRHLLQMSTQDVASLTGTTPAVIRSRVREARRACEAVAPLPGGARQTSREATLAGCGSASSAAGGTPSGTAAARAGALISRSA